MTDPVPAAGPSSAGRSLRRPGELTPLSVIILTKNEEDFVGRAITHIDFADEFVVVDCGSTDRTREVAAGLDAKVVEQDWLGWPEQRNAGAAAARNDWVLTLEADEVVTGQLAASIRRVLSGQMDPRDGYAVDRRDDMLGVLLPNGERRAKLLSFVRMYNRNHTRYDTADPVHERAKPPGSTILLDGVLLHWRGKTIDELMTAINRYATVEAEALDERGTRSGLAKLVTRPMLRFVWHYIVRGAFRQGTRGLVWSTLRAMAEALQWAKLWERQNARGDYRDPPPGVVDRRFRRRGGLAIGSRRRA